VAHLQVAIAAGSEACHGLDGQGQTAEALIAVVAAQGAATSTATTTLCSTGNRSNATAQSARVQ
jgi:hypothetical protein